MAASWVAITINNGCYDRTHDSAFDHFRKEVDVVTEFFRGAGADVAHHLKSTNKVEYRVGM